MDKEIVLIINKSCLDVVLVLNMCACLIMPSVHVFCIKEKVSSIILIVLSVPLYLSLHKNFSEFYVLSI